jgi:hypothetical protein
MLERNAQSCRKGQHALNTAQCSKIQQGLQGWLYKIVIPVNLKLLNCTPTNAQLVRQEIKSISFGETHKIGDGINRKCRARSSHLRAGTLHYLVPKGAGIA